MQFKKNELVELVGNNSPNESSLLGKISVQMNSSGQKKSSPEKSEDSLQKNQGVNTSMLSISMQDSQHSVQNSIIGMVGMSKMTSKKLKRSLNKHSKSNEGIYDI